MLSLSLFLVFYTFLLFSSPFSTFTTAVVFVLSLSLCLSLSFLSHFVLLWTSVCPHNCTCVWCVFVNYVFGLLNICFLCFFPLCPLAIVAHIKCERVCVCVFFYVEFVKPSRVKTATKVQINHQYRYTSIPRWMYKLLNSLEFCSTSVNREKDNVILFITKYSKPISHSTHNEPQFKFVVLEKLKL